jgi:cytochrome P450
MLNQYQLLAHTPRILRDPLNYLTDLTNTHGDVVEIDVAGFKAFVLAEPEAIEHVLVSNFRNYSKETPQFETFKFVAGDGLLNSDGDLWRQQRRIMQPAFHRKKLEKLIAAMIRWTDKRVERWTQKSGQLLLIEDEMMTLSLEILCETLFGVELKARSEELVHTVNRTLDYVMFRARMPFDAINNVPLKVVRDYKASMIEVDRFVDELVAARRASESDHDDLLQLLIEAEDDAGNPLSRDLIRDEIVTMIVAGYETVATGLTWTWYLLDSAPAVVAQARQEIARVLNGRDLSIETLRELTYIQAIYTEGLRLYPPAWVVSRKAMDSDEIAGRHVPAGSPVIISPYAMHHNPRYWFGAERFTPERWLPEWGRKRHKWQYIPFGAGPRLCIGSRFAEMEAAVVLATLLPKFDVAYAAKAAPGMDALVTIRPKNHMPMHVTVR